jgi:hypothetical protein
VYQPPKHERYQLFAGYYCDDVGVGANSFVDYTSVREAEKVMNGEKQYHWGQLVEWRFGRPVVVAQWDALKARWKWQDEEARTG